MTLSRIIDTRSRKDMIMLPCIISQDIVKYFHEVKGFSLEEIANIISASKKDVESILKGLSTFTAKNIKSLIKKQDNSIIKLLVDACPENHLPEKLKKNVALYKHIQKVKRKKSK